MKFVISGGTLGIDEARTHDIIQHSAYVSYASLAVNGAYATEAAELARNRNMPLSFQFNLTNGRPVCLEEGPLVHNGHFLGRAAAFMLLSQLHRDNYKNIRAAIKKELLGQIRRFYALTDQRAFWMDSFDHVHVIPIVFDVIKELLLNRHFRFQLHGLRCPHGATLFQRKCPWIQGHEAFASEADCYGLSFWLRVSYLALRLRARCHTHAIPTRLCIGIDWSESDYTIFHIVPELVELEKRRSDEDMVVEWVSRAGHDVATTNRVADTTHNAAGFCLISDPAFNSFLAENRFKFLSSSNLLAYRKCSL